MLPAVELRCCFVYTWLQYSNDPAYGLVHVNLLNIPPPSGVDFEAGIKVGKYTPDETQSLVETMDFLGKKATFIQFDSTRLALVGFWLCSQWDYWPGLARRQWLGPMRIGFRSIPDQTSCISERIIRQTSHFIFNSRGHFAALELFDVLWKDMLNGM